MVYSIRTNKPIVTTKPLMTKVEESKVFQAITEMLESNEIEFEKTKNDEIKVILKEKIKIEQ